MAEEKKYSGRVIALFGFLPWLVYIFAASGNFWGVATAGGMIACLVYLAVLSGQAAIKLMDWTTLAFMQSAEISSLTMRQQIPVAHGR